jgi:hexosaminidase
MGLRVVGLLLFGVFLSLGVASFSKKSYSCVNGTCQLNEENSPGLAHGICLTTCGLGSLWPYPNGQTTIGLEYSSFELEKVVFRSTTEFIIGKEMQNSFMHSVNMLSVGKNKYNYKGSNLLIEYTVDDPSIIVPALGNDESYELKVSLLENQVMVLIHGVTVFGVRHGFETLSQLISYDYFSGSLVIPNSVYVADKPQFPYRGVMVDISRNFISIAKLKETVQAMGYNKLNVLHLHISDTASFPLELVSQPNMTYYGAYDEEHYYSIAEVKDFVSFAHANGVMLLPEIDMPSHVSAGWQWGALAGLGEFALCTDPDGTHSDQFLADSLEPPSGQLNLANENVYPVLRDIYTEVIGLFQSQNFHLGGDELIIGSDEAWAACYNSTSLGQPILAYIDKLGLSRNDQSTFYELWDNFTMRATSMVQDVYAANSDSKPLSKIHIWGGAGDDTTGVTYNLMLQPDVTTTLPPSLFNIQIWDTTDDSITKTLIGKGYDIILSNTDYVYLDCGNAGFTNAGGYWCQPYHEWYHIYEYIRDISKKWHLTPDELAHIQGSETLIWTEMVDDENLSQKLWPRSAALAEALWSSNYLPAAAVDADADAAGRVERSWYEAAGRMLQWREVMVARGVAAEALMPRWCSQRDPYACYVDAGIAQ